MPWKHHTAVWPVSLPLRTRFLIYLTALSGVAFSVFLNMHIQAAQERKATQIELQLELELDRSQMPLISEGFQRQPKTVSTEGLYRALAPVSEVQSDHEGNSREAWKLPKQIVLPDVETQASLYLLALAMLGTSCGLLRFVVAKRIACAGRAAEKRIAILEQALERSNCELEEFAFVASHDLKAPLRVIENATSWLAEDLAEYLTPDTRESLALVQSRSARMRRFLDDLLCHSRISIASDEGPRISGDSLVRLIVDDLGVPSGFVVETTASMKDTITKSCPLKMVLTHLIGNAIRHHDRDAGRIVVDATFEPACVIYSVSDDGPGIPPEYHGKIFKLFQTLKSRDVLESSGLGLAMVRKKVELIGGSVNLISNGVRGSTFTVKLPAECIHTYTLKR